MSMPMVKLQDLEIGDRFSFVPSAWFGPARLISKTERGDGLIDIKYDANVVNPPGLSYGMESTLRVRLLSRKPRESTRGYRAGYVV